MDKKQEIILLSHRNGESISSISRKVGVCRKTVRSYISKYSAKKDKLLSEGKSNKNELIDDIVRAPEYDSSNRNKRKVTDKIVELVKSCLQENNKKRSRGQQKQLMKKIDIFDYLLEENCDIGYTSICKLINRLERIHAETFIKQKYTPGEICEFDWGEAKIFINDKLRVFQQAVFTSAYGNYRFSFLFPKQNTQCFHEAHALFFEHLGGVFRTIVYDNMRVAVKIVSGQNKKEATDGLLQLSSYYHFDFRFCNIRAGNEKGHVERSVEYIRRKAFARNDRFSSLEEANKHLVTTCIELNKKPQVGNKNKSAKDLFETEKEYLLPIQPKFECAKLSNLRVNKYSTIIVDRCYYSVPEYYTGKMIVAKIYSTEIICFYENKKICTHKKSFGLDEWIIDIEHFLKTLQKKPGAVSGSVALFQMEKDYKNLFEKYFNKNPKEFIELLIYMKEKDLRLDIVESVIKKLEGICPADISLDKIKAILERKENKQILDKDSKIEIESKKQIFALNELIPQKNNLKPDGRIL